MESELELIIDKLLDRLEKQNKLMALLENKTYTLQQTVDQQAAKIMKDFQEKKDASKKG